MAGRHRPAFSSGEFIPLFSSRDAAT
ncbi:hypothetical protein H711_02456, partial [Brucella ovis IntaBari-2009-88-3]